MLWPGTTPRGGSWTTRMQPSSGPLSRQPMKQCLAQARLNDTASAMHTDWQQFDLLGGLYCVV